MIKSIKTTNKFDNFIAVNNLKSNIEKTGIFGLIGPDGAGKTIFTRLLFGIMDPTSGDIFIENRSVKKYPEEVKLLVDYMYQKF